MTFCPKLLILIANKEGQMLAGQMLPEQILPGEMSTGQGTNQSGFPGMKRKET